MPCNVHSPARGGRYIGKAWEWTVYFEKVFGDTRDEISIKCPTLLKFIFYQKSGWDRTSTATRMFHIGQRIKEVFEAQPKSHTIEWFADKLHCKRANIYNIFNRSTIDTDLLLHISRTLNHDFFSELTAELHNTSSKDSNYDAEAYTNLMSSFSSILKHELHKLNERLKDSK